MTVEAPRGGAVTTYKIQLGQGVEAGQELGSFQAAAAAIVRLELPLPAPENWQTGAIAEVRKGDGQRWKARLEGTPTTLTSDTRRLSYRLRLLGGPLPIPGTPLEVHVALAKTVVLPQSALQQVEGTWGVFVKKGEEAVFRPVQRGPELGTDVMVLDGVKPGETVVGEGAYLLKSLQIKRKSGGEDHDH
jgi:cobalt-zinc-cadmium efflux system membrane fusion protein